MCSASVALTIQWRLPFRSRAADARAGPLEDGGDEEGVAPPGANGGLFPEIQVRATSKHPPPLPFSPPRPFLCALYVPLEAVTLSDPGAGKLRYDLKLLEPR